MSRYIDADARNLNGNQEQAKAYNHCLIMIDESKTADVREVVRGQWIDTETGKCRCSHCNTIYEIKAKFLYSYCPNCGLNMVNPITEMIDAFYANKHLYKKIGGADEQIH